MHTLLAPAVALLNRLSFRGKFTIIILCVLIALAGLGGSLGAALWGEVRHTRNEQAGVAALVPTLHAVQMIQQHRGQMVSVLSGKPELKPRADETAAQADRWLDKADAALAASPSLSVTASGWTAVRKDWKDLVISGGSLDAAASRIAHRKVIEALLAHAKAVISASGLLLDTEAGSFYMIDATLDALPDLIERIGKMRATGNLLLSKKTGSDEEREDLTVLMATAEAEYRKVIQKLRRASEGHPEILTSAAALETETGPHLAWLTGVARSDIIPGRYETPAAEWVQRSTTTIDALYKSAFEHFIPELEGLLADRESRLMRTFTLSAAAAIGVALLVIYLLAAVASAIGGAVASLAGNAEKVADGDLTVHVELATRDELQRVASAFNRMGASIAQLLQGAHKTADDLSAAADHLASSSSDVARGSAHQSDAASAMAAAVEEMTVGINHIASNARDAQSEATHAGQLSTEGSEVVRQTVDDIGRISEVVKRSAGIIRKLGDQSSQISAIVGTIKEIADQTNLLALNAAIEAARAGEQGRGFAVVADEVRKLAERTTQSTQEIAGMIGGIQEGAQHAVLAMEEGVERVGEGVDRASQAGTAIARIHTGAGRTVNAINEISDALGEQSAASTEIARQVEGIAQMAESNSISSQASARTAQQLKDLAVRLEQDIGHFRLG
jgi:methyl-accepting chemotaxis protein